MPKTKKGKFIVLEGSDGSGKSTILEYIKELLSKKKNVIYTREPGGTDYAEAVRKILLDVKMDGKISVLSELFTFCALRANHCDLFIRPNLAKGKIIISDRFDPATVAYQIYGYNNLKLSKIFKKINEIAKGAGTTGIIEPDLVIYLDVDPAIGLARTVSRGELDRLGGKELAFYKRVRVGYLSQYEQSSSWLKIDAGQDLDSVKADVKKVIEEHIRPSS